jgi:hypothetical protein
MCNFPSMSASMVLEYQQLCRSCQAPPPSTFLSASSWHACNDGLVLLDLPTVCRLPLTCQQVPVRCWWWRMQAPTQLTLQQICCHKRSTDQTPR